MIEQFYRQHKIHIQLVVIITTIGALFLNIPKPDDINIQNSLLNIQMFWLILITIGLSSVFIDFVSFIIKIEKKLKKNKLPVYASFSIFSASVVFWFICNMWNYIILSYNDNFFEFSKMIYPGLSLVLGTLFLIFIAKKKINILLEGLFVAIIISLWLANVIVGLQKYFKYNITWLKAYFFCLLFILIFMLLIILLAYLSKLKK